MWNVDMIIGYPTIKAHHLISSLLPELIEPVESRGTGKGWPPVPLVPTVTDIGEGDIGNSFLSRKLPYLEELEHVAALHVAHAGRKSDSLPYEGEDVAFRDPNAPWELDMGKLRAGNKREELIKTLSQGVAKNAESDKLQNAIVQLYLRYIDVFDIAVRPEPATVPPMILECDEEQWTQRGRNQGPARPLSEPLQTELRRQINNLLELNVIRPSQEPHYSQVILVNKPGPPPPAPQAKRLCIDFRALNLTLKGMGWPLPNIRELLQRVGSKRAQYYTKIDFTSGYWQASLAEQSRWLTAFITFMGVYEWMRVPMGIKCAGSYYQRSMAVGPLGGLLYTLCELYIDDILIFADSPEQLLERMETIFKRFREFRCTIHPGKIFAGHTEIEFVGHLLSANGLRFSEEKLSGVRQFPRPIVKRQLKSFLGLASYFRDHVRNFATIARPLQDEVGSYAKSERNARIIWTPDLDKSFVDLREAVDNCATLYFMEGSEDPVYLDTDASNYGIGAYLYQRRSDGDYPIMFISKSLDKTQLRWSVPEKEGYAIFYALVKMEHLLRDVPFTLLTDHENLTRIYTTGSQKVLRWRLFIQEFNMKVAKIPGEFNVVADAFSRLCPVNHPEDTDFEEVHAIDDFDTSALNILDLANMTLADESLASIDEYDVLEEETIAQIIMESADLHAEVLPTTHLSTDTSTPAEAPEEVLVQSPDEVTTPPQAIPLGEIDRTILEGRTRAQGLSLPIISSGRTKTTPVARVQHPRVDIPPQYYEAIKRCHNVSVGHFGVDAVLGKLLRTSTAWPRMREHVTQFVRDCPYCQKLSELKVAVQTHPFTLSTTTPMTDLQIDTIGPLPADKLGNCHIVVIVDRCTRYVTLHAAKDTSAEGAAHALIAHMATFGNPSTITSDNGSQFVNDLISDLCKLTLSHHNESIAYSKQSNAMVERANKEVMRHLRAYIMELKSFDKWGVLLPLVQRIMNNHVHTTLGCAPADLVIKTSAGVTQAMLTAGRHNTNVGKWGSDVLAIQNKLLTKALIFQQSIDANHIAHRQPQGGATSFPIDSYVLLSYPETRMGNLPPTKFHSRLGGPFKVASVEGDAYTLTDLVSHKRKRPVHVSRLREFKYNSEYTDPAKIAQSDTLEFEVERILGHEGDIKRRSTLDFLVRWAGYSEEHDLWLPWSELRDNEALHSYLREKGLDKLIPKATEDHQRRSSTTYERSARRA